MDGSTNTTFLSPPCPTSQDTREIVKTWAHKSEQRRRDLCSALNTLEKIAGPGPVPMDCAVLNDCLYRRPPAAYGISGKVFSNVVSALRDILRGMGRHAPYRDRGRDGLTPAWLALYEPLSKERQLGLVRFMKFASHFHIAPEAVCSDMLPVFKEWLHTQTLTDDIKGHARRAASNWTWAAANVLGWPQATLTHAGARETYTLALDAYAPSFLAELDAYLDRLAGTADGGLLRLDPSDMQYLNVERPVLLIGQRHSFLWVSTGGWPLDEDGVRSMLLRRMKARFDMQGGPHAYRGFLATSCANLLPDCPGMAGAILGAGKDVVAKSYAQTSRIGAAHAYTQTIEQARLDTEELANALFADQ